jgi:hypothetical protein
VGGWGVGAPRGRLVARHNRFGANQITKPAPRRRMYMSTAATADVDGTGGARVVSAERPAISGGVPLENVSRYRFLPPPSRLDDGRVDYGGRVLGCPLHAIPVIEVRVRAAVLGRRSA